MKHLTISRARELIKRELGLSTSALTAPDDMNGNPDYPWYEMTSGNMKVEVCTDRADHVTHCELIRLSATHENSSFYVTEYFYADTMEYAPEYTEMKQREVISEIMCEEEDPTLKRLSQEASDALWQHHFDSKKVERTESPAEDLKNKQEALDDPIKHPHGQPASDELSEYNRIMENAAWDNFQGKLLKGHDLFKFQLFNLQEEVYSEAGPFDETQMEWWINNITRGINNNPDEVAGFTILTWDRDSKDWVKYSPDGVTTFTYDTGRRANGVWEQYKKQLPSFAEKNSLLNMLSRARQAASKNLPKSVNKPKEHSIE
jgi:hypothetical protein